MCDLKFSRFHFCQVDRISDMRVQLSEESSQLYHNRFTGNCDFHPKDSCRSGAVAEFIH